MRFRLALLLAALVLWPAAAHAQEEDTSPEDAQTEDGQTEGGDEQATEGEDGYEPDQRGYEPDQRGYEPDQRGEHEDPDTGGGGGDQSTTDEQYEPDQRGYDEDDAGDAEEAEALREEAASEPMSAGADVAAYESGDYGAGLGLDLRLWLGASGAVLDAFGEDNLLRDNQRGGFGGGFGVTLGLRIGQLTIGPRVLVSIDEAATMVTTGLDVMVRLIPDRFAPYVRGALSFVFVPSLRDELPSQGGATGVLTELGVGFGGRVAGPLTLGAEVSAGWVALFRGDVPDCEDPCSDATVDLTRSGEAHGVVIRGLIWVGFGF